MFGHHDELLSCNKSLEPSVEGLIARMNHRLSVGPGHVLCSWEKLFHELVLGAHRHANHPIVRRAAQPKWGPAVDQSVYRALRFINRQVFHIAVHSLAGCAIHDDMDSDAMLGWYHVGTASEKIQDIRSGN